MKPATWIIIALVAAIIAMIWFWPSTDTSDREKEIARFNQELQLRIDSIADRNRALIDSVKKDSIAYVQERASFNAKLEVKNRELARRRSQASESRAEVQPLIDSIPKLRAFVADLDSVVLSLDSLNTIKDHRIAAMEHAYGKLSVNVQGITKNFEQALELERQRYANSQKIIDLKNKEIRKHKREKKIAVIGGIAATVVALLI